MRTRGTKNSRPVFMTHKRLTSKAAKTKEMLDDFVEKSLRNYSFKNVVDYDAIAKVIENLEFITTIKS